jgi:hypothetical protein
MSDYKLNASEGVDHHPPIEPRGIDINEFLIFPFLGCTFLLRCLDT